MANLKFRRLSLALAVQLTLLPLGLPAVGAGLDRFLYVLDCDAKLDKLDTVEGRKLATFDLTTRTGTPSLFPVVEGTLEACLASQAVYDARASSFATAVATTNAPNENGTKDYRILTFSVPDIQFLKVVGDEKNQPAPPHLEQRPEGLQVALPSGWSPPTTLDLSSYAPDKADRGNRILESSGDRVLLRLYGGGDDRFSLAVANQATKTLVRLKGVPSTTALNVHLAPGGEFVLVEETGAGAKPDKTGRLVLFNADTGTPERDLRDPRVRSLYFLAMSPTGRAVYHASDDYSFINLEFDAGDAPVTRLTPTPSPAYFVGDR